MPVTPQRQQHYAVKATPSRHKDKPVHHKVPTSTAQRQYQVTFFRLTLLTPNPATATAHCPDFLLFVNSFHFVGELLNSAPRIKKLLKIPDYKLMKSIENFWDFKYDKNNLYSSWLSTIENKFNSQIELRDIPIRKLIEQEACASL